MKPKTVKEYINNSATMLNTMEAMEAFKEERKNGIPEGVSTGWKSFDKYFTFPPRGQLNVVTGVPSSGKTEWMDSMALNMAVREDWKIFYYSPENYPAVRHLQSLCSKFANKPLFGKWNGWENVNDHDVELFEKLLINNFSFVDCHINNASIDSILDSIFLECINKRVNMAIIDPINKLESQRPSNIPETEFIGKMLTRIQMFARQNKIHFFLIAHPAKPTKNKKGTYNDLTLYDISGSANFFNMVDNGFIVHRNWKDKTGNDGLNRVKIAKIKDRWYGRFGEVRFRFIPASGNFEEVQDLPKAKAQSELAI